MRPRERHADDPVRHPPVAMNLLLCQITFAVAIFMAVVFFCLVPFVLVRGRRWSSALDADATGVHFWKRIFGWCDCLTGGVFLAICFLSLLPNVQEQADAVLHDLGLSIEFPVAECAVLLGFFAVLVVDQAGRRCASNRRLQRRRIIEMDSLGILDRGGDDDDDDVGSGGALEDRRTLLAIDDSSTLLTNGNRQLRFDDADDFEVGSPTTDVSPSSNRPIASGTRLFRAADLMIEKNPSKEDRGLRFLIMLFAVGIHAIFVGIVLGLQTEVHEAVHLFVAVIVHESVVSLTLGFNVAKTCHSVWTVARCGLLLGACIPVGIGMGIAIERTPSLLVHSISSSMQALAAGMFLHITFMQLLPHEFGHGGSLVEREGLLNTLFIFVGFVIMTTLNLTLGFVH